MYNYIACFFYTICHKFCYICNSPVAKTANLKSMSNKNFDKFINKEPKGSAKKEAFRQEKRSAKAAARAAGEEARRKKQDKAVDLLIDRCNYYMISPVANNWDGVFTRKHK